MTTFPSKLVRLLAATLFSAVVVSQAQAGVLLDSRVAYWNFDTFTPGDVNTNVSGPNRPSRAGDTTEGTFADMWTVDGNADTVYAANLDGGGTVNNNAPFSSAGRFGGAFYSNYNPNGTGTSEGFGAVGMADHTAALDFTAGTSFTVSGWVKVANRESVQNSFQPGFGRSIYWMKSEDTAVNPATPIGLGLRVNGSSFGVAGERSGGFGQDFYDSVNYTTTPGNLDDGDWAHTVVVGNYNAGTNMVDLETYVDGVHITNLDVSVPAADLSTNGPLGIGHFWRQQNGTGSFGAQAQHGLGWNARDTTADPGEGWLDDLAFIDAAFTSTEVVATFNLAEETSLDYAMESVLPLLDLHREADPDAEVDIDGLVWRYLEDDTIFTAGNLGVVKSIDGDFYVGLAAGTGITTLAVATAVPEPASVALWCLAGLAIVMVRKRRR